MSGSEVISCCCGCPMECVVVLFALESSEEDPLGLPRFLLGLTNAPFTLSPGVMSCSAKDCIEG